MDDNFSWAQDFRISIFVFLGLTIRETITVAILNPRPDRDTFARIFLVIWLLILVVLYKKEKTKLNPNTDGYTSELIALFFGVTLGIAALLIGLSPAILHPAGLFLLAGQTLFIILSSSKIFQFISRILLVLVYDLIIFILVFVLSFAYYFE